MFAELACTPGRRDSGEDEIDAGEEFGAIRRRLVCAAVGGVFAALTDDVTREDLQALFPGRQRTVRAARILHRRFRADLKSTTLIFPSYEQLTPRFESSA